MRAEIISLNKEVTALLAEAQLPTSDLSISRNLNLLGLREEGQLVGVVGIQVHGETALLRSLVVARARRNYGLGTVLLSNAEAWAAERGINTLYLLTTTAAEFFFRHGYEPLSRSKAPAAIAATAQFSDLCPASSTLMRKVSAANNSLHRTTANERPLSSTISLPISKPGQKTPESNL